MSDMQIIVLGSGTIKAPAERNCAGYLLRDLQSGACALLDCGPGILKRLYDCDIDPSAIDAVFLSHYHVDHCSDLLPLLLNRYVHDNNGNRALTISGPRDIREWFAAQATWQGSWMNEKGPRVQSVEMVKEWRGWKIEACLTGHTENSLAFAFSKNKKRFFYSGDSGYNEAIVRLARGADLAICECAVPDSSPREGHMTPSDLQRFVEQAKPARTLATHIYPENDPPALKKHNRTIETAYDLQSVEI